MRALLQAASKEAGSAPLAIGCIGSVFCLQAAAFAVLNQLTIPSTLSAACSFFQGKDPTLTDIASNTGQ